MISLEDPTTLSLLFHLNSEPWLNAEAYKSAGSAQEFKDPPGILAKTPLPPPAASELTRLSLARRSTRAFQRRQMKIESLSALLSVAYGLADHHGSGDAQLLRRSIPSAGGLFPLEIYPFARRIDGLDDGLYHYDVLAHGMQLLRAGDLFPSLEPLFYTYPFIADANVGFAIAAVFRRTQKKYGPRGYRYILLEAGHCAQNICLRGVELGVDTLCMGGFVDSRLNRFIGLDPCSEGVVYSVAAGFAARE
jgi:SagB-type dehydrogenase family enzyme